MNSISDSIIKFLKFPYEKNHSRRDGFPEENDFKLIKSVVLFSLLYLAGAFLGNYVTIQQNDFTTFWPPVGVLVAALLINDQKQWKYFIAAAFLTSFVHDIFTYKMLLVSLAFTTADVLEAFCGVYIVRKFIKGRITFIDLKETLVIFIITALISTTIGATIGTITGLLLSSIESLSNDWISWYVGDLLGIILVAPIFIALNSKEMRALFKIDYKKRLEFFLLLSGVVFTSLLVFSNFSGLGKVDNFLISPLLLWAALRFGLFGTSLSTFIITIIAIWHSKEGYGEFYSTKATLAENLLSLQAYLITVSLSINTLAIIIARQRKTEYDLKIEKDYLDILMNQTPDTIYFKDVDSRFTRINKPQVETLGLTNHSQAVGKTDFDFFPAELADQFFTDEQKIIKSGEPIIGKIESITDSKKRIHWFSTTKLPMKDPEGKIIGIVGVSRDITAIKKIEEELRELNSSKDRLFSIIAHDLKSPFMGLIGYSDLILEQFDELDKDQLRKWISDIHKSIHSIFKLIENLLNWSRLQTDKFEYSPGKVNLFESAAYGINLVIANAKNKEIEIINRIQNDLFVFADENMLNSILGNLLSNGIKFSHRGGKILINSALVDHSVEVSVEDNGIGICPKDQSKIFSVEVSHTTRGTEDEKGTGLGLVLCKEMIERHGGQIRVESTKGKGTKFIFTLPMAKSERQEVKIESQ